MHYEEKYNYDIIFKIRTPDRATDEVAGTASILYILITATLKELRTRLI